MKPIPLNTKPIKAKPSLYAYYFEVIKSIGMVYGYNIVLHGSMDRDLDLIAIPWVEEIGDKVKMISDIAQAIGGFVLDEPDAQRAKPHGREAWTININRNIVATYCGFITKIHNNTKGDPQYYIDISIMPTKTN